MPDTFTSRGTLSIKTKPSYNKPAILKNLSALVIHMDYSVVSRKVKHHVLMLFQSHHTDRLLYHNRAHTEQVVEACTKMAEYYRLNDKDRFIVTTAAWFHDTGYFDNTDTHEIAGVARAEAFLQAEEVDAETITAVKNCILATQMPQHPANLMEQIVCDADLFHLGMNGFFKRNKWLREESETLHHKTISKKKWLKSTLQLLEQHQYYTDYSRKHLNDKKQEHIEALKQKIGEPHERAIPATANGKEEKEGKEDNRILSFLYSHCYKCII